MKTNLFTTIAVAAALALTSGCSKKPEAGKDGAPQVLRVGFFPNITHAQGLIGYHETNTKAAEAFFEKRLGVKVEWYPFNAGPSAIEALIADSIDLTYVGPNPVLNGYTRTKGEDIRVLIGSARGGASLVIQKDSPLATPADFKGKKIASPQLGGTQDVAARAWLKAGGLNITTTGGDANVIPTPNPDQLDLFKRKEIDAAWTVEPWVSRLELEGEGKILLEQKDVLTTLLATKVKTISGKAELLKKFIAAHEELTKKIVAEPDFAKEAVGAALQKATTRPIPKPLLDKAWPRLTFTTTISLEDFSGIQKDAKSVGLLPEEADLGQLFFKP